MTALVSPLRLPGFEYRRMDVEGVMVNHAMDDYIRCFADPRTIAGSCADYRAAASTDLVHDEETFAAGERIECPLLALWGTQAFVGRGYEPLSVWPQYATDVRGAACRPVTSCPKRHRTWSPPPCAISSANPRSECEVRWTRSARCRTGTCRKSSA